MKRLIYTFDTSIDEAIGLLDAGGIGFLPVVDENNYLLGIITDGDLRRAVIHKQVNLESIINKEPLVAKKSTPKTVIKEYLQKNHRRHMPILDDAGRLVDVFVLNDFGPEKRPNTVVIMAGGLGSRLGELTKETPKPMLKVGDKPILQHIISNFQSHGFNNFTICLNFKSKIIEDYFRDGREFGAHITYTKEEKRMGTAGALSLIKEEFSYPVFVANGDVISNVDFERFLDFHMVSEAPATMCVKKMAHEIAYASVEFDEKHNLVHLKEKPTMEYFINTGLYVLNSEVIKEIPKDTYYDMPSLFEKLNTGNKKCKVFPAEDYWLDIGRPDDFEKGKELFKKLG
jgi:dTDP-glucose pyrophosphorylase